MYLALSRHLWYPIINNINLQGLLGILPQFPWYPGKNIINLPGVPGIVPPLLVPCQKHPDVLGRLPYHGHCNRAISRRMQVDVKIIEIVTSL